MIPAEGSGKIKTGRKAMDYRKFGKTVYVRMDKGDEIIENILDICKKENILSAIFSGIGGCSEAQIQTFLPESGTFETQTVSGMLEMVSLTGSVISDEQKELYHHTHGMFSYKDGDKHCVSAGHIKSITVLYTAEIELRPVEGGVINRQFNPETGTGFWSF
jgi:predicted DNA-binding protein with PD1-like motif